MMYLRILYMRSSRDCGVYWIQRLAWSRRFTSNCVYTPALRMDLKRIVYIPINLFGVCTSSMMAQIVFLVESNTLDLVCIWYCKTQYFVALLTWLAKTSTVIDITLSFFSMCFKERQLQGQTDFAVPPIEFCTCARNLEHVRWAKDVGQEASARKRQRRRITKKTPRY